MRPKKYYSLGKKRLYEQINKTKHNVERSKYSDKVATEEAKIIFNEMQNNLQHLVYKKLAVLIIEREKLFGGIK